MKKAVILLSGGLDSLTVSAIAKNEGYKLYGMSFHYGQRNEIELKMAKKIAKKYNFIDHKIVRIDTDIFQNNALNNGVLPVTVSPAFLNDMFKAINEYKTIPTALGFGISNKEQAIKLKDYADGIIIGSAIVKMVEKYKEDCPRYIGEFVKDIVDNI